MQIHEIQRCRICGNPLLIPVIDLGSQALSGRFPKKDDPDPPVAPLVLVKCGNEKNPGTCGLVQLKHSVDPGEMYGNEYGYRSGINKTMRDHLGSIVQKATEIVSLDTGDIVLDIGSNDGTLLKSYNRPDIRRIGIDPGGAQFRNYYPDNIRLVSDFFTAENFSLVFPGEKARIITSIAMFYDLENPMTFVRNIKEILHPEGVWILEQSYLPTMLEMNSFDTICHEHLEYYAFYQIAWMLKKNGLEPVGIDFNLINGGSFRVYVAHAGSSLKPDTAVLADVVAMEKDLRLETMEPYAAFCTRIEDIRARLTALLKAEKAAGKKIYVYGASTKGNILLNYFGFDSDLITAAADRNPEKWGSRTPGTNIPIVSEEEARADADIFLPLPWHFKKEFLERESEFIKKGGRFVFPLPDVEVV